MNKTTMILLCGVFSFYLGYSQENENLFQIHFKQDFEDDTPGDYIYQEMLEDFPGATWSDPRYYHDGRYYWDEYDQIKIIQENGNQFLRHITAEGEMNTGVDHGMQWWLPLNKKYDEIYFTYRMRLPENWDHAISGKFIGIAGTPRPHSDYRPKFDDGYSARLSWTSGDWGEDLMIYCYHHDQPGNWGQVLGLGMGGWYGIPDDGKWHTYSIRIVMNSVGADGGNNDGVLEVWLDGEIQLQKANLRFRNHESIGTDVLEITNFYGGTGEEFAPKSDQPCDFDDLCVWEYSSDADCVRGNNVTPRSQILIPPGIDYQKSTSVPEPEPEPETRLDTTKIFIEAYGDELNGKNAHFQILVNNKMIDESDATSSSATHAFDLESPAGSNDTVYIVFTNDEYIEGTGDRNLYVRSITYNGYKYYPDRDNVVYAYEGSSGIRIVEGTSDMPYAGQLVFFTGETSVSPDLLDPLFQKSPFFTNSTPVILNQSYICKDTLKDGTEVVTVSATDPDPDQLLSYQILSGNTSNAFALDASTGKITVANSAYLKNNDQFLLEVRINDDHPLSRSDTGLVVININHIEEEVPVTEEEVPVTEEEVPVTEEEVPVTEEEVQTADIYYIDPSNINDLSEDGSMAHPFDSWSDVNWKSGNTYLQKSGTIAYEKKINMGASDITIGSYGEGDLPMIRSQAKDFAMRAYERNNITIKDVHIIADEAISCIYFLGATCDNILINNCVFESSNNGVRIIEGKSFDISYNTFIGCADAIYSFAENNRIYYNVFKENITAIHVNSYLSKANIFNNVFYYNSTGVSASYSELVIYNNIFYLKEQNNQALNYNFDKLVSDNNIYYPEQQGFLNINNVKYASLEEYQTSTGLDMNSFTQDPQFIDVYNNNFGLKSTSPAIDAGKDVGASEDFFGTAVPYGNAPDIGLKETQEARSVTGINDNLEDMSASDGPVVYPNPTDGLIQISYQSSSTTDMEVTIKDISGRTVFMDQIPGGYSSYHSEIDISSQPTGIYMALFNVCGKSYMQKIVKR